MKFIYYSPSEVPNEIVIFILPRAVVSMKMDVGFTKSMVLKVMMNITNRCICPFSNVTCLVNEIVPLPRYCFTHDAKVATFAWGFKINRSWLQWVTRNMYLLGEVVWIVDSWIDWASFMPFIQIDCPFEALKVTFWFHTSVLVEISFCLDTV